MTGEAGPPHQDEEPSTATPDEPGDSEPPDDAPAAPACDDPDGDGYGPGCALGADCAPIQANSHPGAGERCFDHTDNDCDGVTDEDCDCDPAVADCSTPDVPSTQTLGEFVFELTRGALQLDAQCGGQRATTLDESRATIVSNIDGLVTRDDAHTMGEVARQVLRPLLESGDLETTANAGADAVALLVDDGFDPERRTLSALVELLRSDTALEEAHVFGLLDAGLADARIPDLLHATTLLAGKPSGQSTVADDLLHVASSALSASSDTLSCSGLELTALSDRLLDGDALAGYAPEGVPALVGPPDAQIDAARTGLGLTVSLARDALSAGVHRDASLVLDAALGKAESCGTDCVAYPGADHPVADAAHVAVDFMRYDEARAFLDGVAVLARDRPEVAEKLLVAVGKLVTRARAADLTLAPAQVVRLARDLLPLLERIFAQGGQTPRLLLQAVHDLGSTSRVFPTRLKWTLDYAQLTKSPTCSDNAPDLSRSRAVDYKSAPGSDNRSSLEQVIELLAAVDCGTVPFTGKSVGLFVLDTVADMKPSTVCGVTDTLLGALHITGVVGDFFTKLTLRGIGCSDPDRVVQKLDALEDLAASGALDFLIPLDKVFADQGQLRTLIQIFEVVADDLALEDDADPGTHSVFRQLEPVMSDLIAEGAADALFDLADVLVTVESVDAHGQQTTLGNVLVDAVAFGIGTRDLSTRRGVVHSSHAAELLGPAERVLGRLSSEESKAALGRVMDHLLGYVRPGSDGLLAQREILPFLRIWLDGMSEVWALPRATRDCYVDGVRSDAERLLLSPELARLMRAVRVLRDSPERALLEQVLIDFMSARPAPARDVRTPILQVSAELLQSSAPEASLSELLPYLAKVIDPDVTHGPAALDTLDTLVQGDTQQVFLGILRNSVHASAPDAAPMAQLLRAYTPALAVTGPMCSPEYEPWTPGGLDSAVHSLLDILRDPEHGMPALFDALEGLALP